MASAIRFEDRLEGANNYSSWKFRIMMILKENKLDSFVKENRAEPEHDPEKTVWIESNEKAMKIIVDAVRDHIVLILSKYETAYCMFKSLESTYEINNSSRCLSLKRQINHINMNKGESINAYFMRISALRDQLSSLG